MDALTSRQISQFLKKRGRRTSIILPRRNDDRIVGAISRADYPVLVRAGVRIFEFEGSLLHAKIIVVDEALALVGSSNMDRHSLDPNFENNVLFESAALASEVIAHQRGWLSNSCEIIESARPIGRSFVASSTIC